MSTPMATTSSVTFMVDGRPRPKQSTRFAGRGAYTPKPIKEAQGKIADAASETGVRFVGPLRVHLVFHGGTGDLDNLCKLVLDGLQQAQMIVNDKYVNHLTLERGLPAKPNRTIITVSGEKESK